MKTSTVIPILTVPDQSCRYTLVHVCSFRRSRTSAQAVPKFSNTNESNTKLGHTCFFFFKSHSLFLSELGYFVSFLGIPIFP